MHDSGAGALTDTCVLTTPRIGANVTDIAISGSSPSSSSSRRLRRSGEVAVLDVAMEKCSPSFSSSCASSVVKSTGSTSTIQISRERALAASHDGAAGSASREVLGSACSQESKCTIDSEIDNADLRRSVSASRCTIDSNSQSAFQAGLRTSSCIDISSFPDSPNKENSVPSKATNEEEDTWYYWYDNVQGSIRHQYKTRFEGDQCFFSEPSVNAEGTLHRSGCWWEGNVKTGVIRLQRHTDGMLSQFKKEYTHDWSTPTLAQKNQAEEYSPGDYRILANTLVKEEIDVISNDVIRLLPGMHVRVLEISRFEDRIRARVENPAGWISLYSETLRKRWATQEAVASRPNENKACEERNGGLMSDPHGPICTTADKRLLCEIQRECEQNVRPLTSPRRILRECKQNVRPPTSPRRLGFRRKMPLTRSFQALSKKESGHTALSIKKEWLDLILSGRKTWEIRSAECHKRGLIRLAESKSGKSQFRGYIVGEAMVEDAFEVTLDTLSAHPDKHCIPDVGIISYTRIFAWVLKDARRYEIPQSYKPKVGAMTWRRLDAETVQRCDNESSKCRARESSGFGVLLDDDDSGCDDIEMEVVG